MISRDDFDTFEEYAAAAKAEMRAELDRRQAKWASDVRAMRREHGQDYVDGYFDGIQAETSEIETGYWTNELDTNRSEEYQAGFKQAHLDHAKILQGTEGIV